jgi:hypothetical protein
VHGVLHQLAGICTDGALHLADGAATDMELGECRQGKQARCSDG